MSFNREKLEKKFREEYQRLDENQRLAVDTIEGPVMVIAGPGTGKTQVLACRIGKILLDTDYLPQNILCLTFTDAGVVAMRKRLVQFIGADAYKVHIYTFHSFCNEVIQENLHRFERTSLDPISDLERIELYKQLIDSFPRNNPLKRYRGDVYYEVKNLSNLFSNMKREGWTPAFLNLRIDEFVANLAGNEEFIYKNNREGKWKKGDLKPSYYETLERLEKTRAAVNEFDHYQQLMRERKRYDFDDMINWVIKAFEEDSNLLANYQERFQYLLVDEYQDTSGTQNRLVELLISYWENPNVFVVGDDDQSIYRFQGANVENMEQFMNSYTGLVLVVLRNNYRSIQPILDVSKAVIQQNMERLILTKPERNLNKDLVAAKTHTAEDLPAFLVTEYETQRHEMIGITLKIEDLISRGTEPGEIGIIYRENKYGEELMIYLQVKQIPAYSKRSLNILDLALIRKLVLILRYLDAEHDIPYGGDELLFEILHLDWFHIPPIEIAKLSVEASQTKFSDRPSSMRSLLYDKSQAIPRDLFSPTLPEPLKNAGAILEKLIGDVTNLTLQQLIENVIREAGILHAIMESADKYWQLQILTGFFDFVKLETLREPAMELKKLIRIIDLIEKEDLSLPLVQVSGSEQGVNLMTAHGAKGLEFKYIFFAGCNSSYWEKKRKPAGGYKLPDNIFDNQPKHGDEEELRRLFYVALTRAKDRLYLSFAKYKVEGKIKDLEPSMFVEEIIDEHPDSKPVKGEISDEEIMDFSSLLLSGQAPEIVKGDDEFINRLLEKFVLSVTALNNYLHCPLEFYYRNLVRIPSPKNENTEFGSAVHYALEKLFRKMQEGGQEKFGPKEDFIFDFNWYMQRHRESFTKEQFDRRMEYGEEVLSNYYDKYINSFVKIVSIERNIRQVLVKDVPLKGKLDKLEFDGKSANVVDYKTGDPDKAKEKLKGPNDKDPLGGDYWRQAVFYKILVDNYERKDWKVVSTEFDFIEPDNKKNYRRQKLLITQEDIDIVTGQITDAWKRIQNHEFTTGCGKEDCHWCDFVKTHDLAIALHEIEEEEEL